MPELEPCDPASVAPTKTRKGVIYPDGFNHPFKRHVSIDEARARGWPYYFDGSTCRHGHICPRPVSNKDACPDCRRLKEGKPLIGATARHQTFYKPRKPEEISGPAQTVVVAPQAPPEPDARDKAFLAAYADFRDIKRAAQDVGSTPALIEARRACNPVFAAAMEALETRLGIPKRVILSALPFTWTDVIRTQLVRNYIDTGDLKTAQDSVGVSPSQFFEEEANNAEFAAALAAARPLAARVLEAIAQQRAIGGDSKLLDKIWTANRQESDPNPTEKLTVEQLRAEAIRIVREFKLTDRELDRTDGGTETARSGAGASGDAAQSVA